MALQKLNLSPTEGGSGGEGRYAVRHGNEFLRVELDGGMPRYRRDKIGTSSRVDVQWACNLLQYQYLEAFYRTVVKNGSDPFLVDLILDNPVTKTYEAHFVPGTYGLATVTGLRRVVSAQLDVKPQRADREFDEAIVAAYNAYGDSMDAVNMSLDEFIEHYVNTNE